MDNEIVLAQSVRDHSFDKFLYFFMGLRKGEIRRRVDRLKSEYPTLGPEQLARVLIDAQTPLSFLSGTLLHVPALLPGIGPVLKLIGIAGGATVIMRMHLFLVLEIAMLFGRDIDDRERLNDMATVIAASGLASGATMACGALPLKPFLPLITGSMAVTVISRVIGETAIKFYSEQGMVDSRRDAGVLT